MENSAVVTIHQLLKHFPVGGDFFTALKDITLTFAKREFTGLVGPSGSGKTTLLNIIGGLDSPTEGKVNVLGKALDNTSHGDRALLRRKHMGFIFQSYNLLPVYTVFENVELPLLVSGYSGKEARSKALEKLAQVELVDWQHHLPGELSGGQRQRVTLARALVNDPAIVWADEPTSVIS